jgi:glycosyltransferase involved in cell wall biosynthesis
MRIVISASYGHSLINFRGELIKELVKQGYEVICTSIEPEVEMKDSINRLGAKYYRIPGTRTGTGLFSNLVMLFCYIKAYWYLKPDICYLYMSKPIAFGGFAAILCNIRHVLVFVTGLEVAFYSPGIKNLMVRSILILMYKIVHLKSKYIFFMNHDDYRKMLKWRLVKEQKAVIVNGSGVNMKYFTKKAMPVTDAVCMTARLVWSKGIREYIEAAEIVRKKYPNVNFMLVGGLDENPEAVLKEELDEVIKKGLIEHCGFVHDVRPYLERCTIFVLPSYHEGNGRSIVEAEAIGRPIITTDATGCRETVIDGYNGFLVPIKDSRKLAERILLLLENENLKMSMAVNSYQLCLEKFDVKQINKVFIEKINMFKNK